MFDDKIVKVFDTKDIDYKAFGGYYIGLDNFNNSSQQIKIHNAYMLFYNRVVSKDYSVNQTLYNQSLEI